MLAADPEGESPEGDDDDDDTGGARTISNGRSLLFESSSSAMVACWAVPSRSRWPCASKHGSEEQVDDNISDGSESSELSSPPATHELGSWLGP